MMMLLGLLSIDTCILVARYYEAPSLLVSDLQRECVTTATSQGFNIALMVLKGLLLAAGAVLTYQIRNIPSQFNESQFLAASVLFFHLICSFDEFSCQNS